MDLIKQLTEGSVEYRENGEVIRHPPTATMLKAARMLVAIDKEHTANLTMLLKSQQTCNELLQEVETLRNQLHDIRNPKTPTESLCDDKQEAVPVVHGGDGPSESNSAGEGLGTN